MPCHSCLGDANLWLCRHATYAHTNTFPSSCLTHTCTYKIQFLRPVSLLCGNEDAVVGRLLYAELVRVAMRQGTQLWDLSDLQS